MKWTDTRIEPIRQAAIRLRDAATDFDELFAAMAKARLVLIGEASHGTHEFYSLRARITRQLMEHHGFSAVIVEADWPDAYRVNRYVRGLREDPDGNAALSGLWKFPQWMWRNEDVLEFVEWLKRWNMMRPSRMCGFYGMDLYSLYGSIAAVLSYLDRVDPEAAGRARMRYGCFEPYQENPHAYGHVAGFELGRSCHEEVVAQLAELQRSGAAPPKRGRRVVEDEHFVAEQNARLIKNAEEYYRHTVTGDRDTWNLRDSHMVETIELLLAHLDRTGGKKTRAVAWAHNSHLGDARATDMATQDQINVGQLCRQKWGEDVFTIGFTTHAGTVGAASHWGDPFEVKAVKPSLHGSYERLFHDAGVQRALWIFATHAEAARALMPRMLERAIGVIYRPRTERYSHYFEACLPQQFDAVIHLDVTTAVRPLEGAAPFEAIEAETYPSGV